MRAAIASQLLTCSYLEQVYACMKNGHPQEQLSGDIIKTYLSIWNH